MDNGYDHKDIDMAPARLLIEKKFKIGCVESCTGGYASKYLTDRAGSSAYFTGGLVTYSDEAKTRLAGVDPALIHQHGAVSREVAEAMALGGMAALGCDVCLSVTGIAGPSGGSEEKPVGTVWFAVAGPEDQLVSKERLFNGDREEVRRKSVLYGLNLVRLALEGA